MKPNLMRMITVMGKKVEEPYPVIANNELLLIVGHGMYQDSAKTIRVMSDGDRVGAWEDQSGNARHVQQATAANRPFFRKNTLNGMDSIGVEASPQHLKSVANAALFSGNDATLIVVYSTTTASCLFKKPLVLMQASNSSNRVLIDVGNGTTSASYSSATDKIMQDGTPYIVIGQVSAASVKEYKNGSTQITSATPSIALSDVSTAFYVHSNDTPTSAVHKLYFLAIYSRVLSTTELNQIGGYLNRRFAISWTNF